MSQDKTSKPASTPHRRNVCFHHYKEIGLVTTLTCNLRLENFFAAMPTHMMNICGKFQ